MKKTIKSHEEKETKQRQEVPEGAVPAYLLDREKQSRAKILSNTIKQKRKEKAVEFLIEIYSRRFVFFCRENGMYQYRKSKQSVKPKFFELFNRENDEVSQMDFEVFVCNDVLEKAWKRLVTKPCFVGEGFTRKPPKFERFIRPMVNYFKSSFLFLINHFRHFDSQKHM
jgi:ribosome biogenesis protein NSA2